ncbi:MAG: DUF134 domain-containing protein [Candidatus Latescibacterota bacterium]|nr:MAG: DUF134 domain-containing protein [Candidatus Latescibacterota bacterium]
MRGSYRKRRIQLPPRFGHFKPAGVPKRFLEKIDLTVDEFEAIRLADYEQLEHLEASEKMNISRPTFTRLIEKARGKVAAAIIEGKELVIEGGNIDFVNTLHHCRECGEVSPRSVDEDAEDCPDCGSPNVEDLAWHFSGRHRGRRGRIR